jgi:exosortase A-associated hydrolase 1
MREEPFFFDCEGVPLLGVLARPERSSGIGIVIVVGGPQYRVGSHRHFVLLARRLAAAGHPTLRFDVRGMGDSDGSAPGFEASTPDVRAAVDALVARVPDLRAVLLWGLCDGATAAAFAAAGDGRVRGAVMLNPWIRTTAGESEAVVKHYYRQRLLSAGFWRKLAGGRFDLRRSLAEAWMHWKRARGGAVPAPTALPDRLGDAMLTAGVPALVLLAGRDATAAEFSLAGARDGALRRWLGAPDVRVEAIAEADHTLSRAAWRERADAVTLDWIAARFHAAA